VFVFIFEKIIKIYVCKVRYTVLGEFGPTKRVGLILLDSIPQNKLVFGK